MENCHLNNGFSNGESFHSYVTAITRGYFSICVKNKQIPTDGLLFFQRGRNQPPTSALFLLEIHPFSPGMWSKDGWFSWENYLNCWIPLKQHESLWILFDLHHFRRFFFLKWLKAHTLPCAHDRCFFWIAMVQLLHYIHATTVDLQMLANPRVHLGQHLVPLGRARYLSICHVFTNACFRNILCAYIWNEHELCHVNRGRTCVDVPC